MNTSTLEQLVTLLKENKLMLATAESCTGGKLAAYCTDLAGASSWFDCALVTYSYDAKEHLLGVKAATLNQEGAVSEICVQEMLQGLFKYTRADVGVAISGIAGPEGGTLDKPVGTVWFAIGKKGQQAATFLKVFAGDRDAIREAACDFAVAEIINCLVKCSA